jgi:DNA mismatch repair ATPase MutL
LLENAVDANASDIKLLLKKQESTGASNW